MDNLSYVAHFAYNLLQTRLTFAPFSFSVWEFMLATFILGLVIDFFVDLFNS